MRLPCLLSLLLLLLHSCRGAGTLSPQISITLTTKYLSTPALPTSKGAFEGIDGEFHPEKVNLAAKFARPWGGALFKSASPCQASFPPTYLRTQNLVAFLPLPEPSDCSPLTALKLLQTHLTLDGIILYIPISSAATIDDISETDIDTITIPVLVITTEMGATISDGLDALVRKRAPEGQVANIELVQNRVGWAGGYVPSIPVPVGGYPPYHVSPSGVTWGRKKSRENSGSGIVKRQDGGAGGEGHWIGYVDVVTVRTTLVPYNGQDMDVGLLWQFGLALIAGVLFFGIPCTCLISWFARRRLEQHIVELEDLETGHNQPDTDSPIVPDHVMNEADLKLFPVKKYRKRDGIVSIQDGDVVPEKKEGDVAMAADGHDRFHRELEEGVSCVTLFPEEVDLTDLPRNTDSATRVDKPKTPVKPQRAPSTRSSLSTVTNYSIDTCAICLDVFEDGCTLRELRPCKHYFHKECIEMWVTKRNGVCPICRVDLLNPEKNPETRPDVDPPHLHRPGEVTPTAHAEEACDVETGDVSPAAPVPSAPPAEDLHTSTLDTSSSPSVSHDDGPSESVTSPQADSGGEGAELERREERKEELALPHQPEGR